MAFESIENWVNLFLKNFPSLSLAFLFALFISASWLFFYYWLSKKLTTSQIFLMKVFGLGMLAAIFAIILEKGILLHFLPEKLLFLLQQKRLISELEELLMIFLLASLFTSLPEEIIKFLFLKIIIARAPSFDQIIDGIKFGIVLGLGFGVIENTFSFFSYLSSSPFQIQTLLILFLMRSLLPSLAHSIYGGTMGYYLSLATFYKIFQGNFFFNALLIPFLIHSLFNFFVFTPFNLIAVLLITFTLLILLKWYLDRQHFQIMLAKEPSPLSPPIFSEHQEIQALIFKSLPRFRLLKKFGICPFCFKRLKIIDNKCSYCGLPIS